MKRSLLVLLTFLAATALFAQETGKKTLYVYDEVNDSSRSYIVHFKAALDENGIVYDEATVAEARSKDLSAYDRLVIHAMYMAFKMQSPVRDWLKGEPNLDGKEASLFVTSSKSKAEKLSGQLSKLLKKDGVVVSDAVSMATKDLSDQEKARAVKDWVGRLK